jgi:hypothetical protein
LDSWDWICKCIARWMTYFESFFHNKCGQPICEKHGKWILYDVIHWLMCDGRSEFVMVSAGAGILYTCGKAMLVICSMAIMTVGIRFISITAHTWELSWKMCSLRLSRAWIRQKHGFGLRQESPRKKKM